MKSTIVLLPYGLTVRTYPDGSGAVSSKLRQELLDQNDSVQDQVRAEAACDAIESLLLALVCAGVKLDTAAAQDGIRVAIDCIAENLH